MKTLRTAASARLHALAAALLLVAPGAARAQAAGRSAAPLALVHATLIDGSGTPARSGMTILIRGGRIAALGPDGSPAIPDSAVVRDATGLYVLPGLIDSHVHLATNPSGSDRRDLVERRLRNALLGGVVAVRDMAGDARMLADLSRAAAAGDLPAPDIHYAALMGGPSFFADPRVLAASAGYAPGTAPFARALTDTTDLRQAVAEARGTGAAGIKLYAALDGALAARVTAEAHRQGLSVWAHLALFPARPSDVVTAGVDAVSHALLAPWEVAPELPGWQQRARVNLNVTPDDPAIHRLFALMRERGTIFEPTLWVSRADSGASDTSLARRREARALELVRAAHEAGVRIAAGTDGIGRDEPGALPNLHGELELLVRAGLTPMEALVAATRTSAAAAGFAATHGAIEVGRAADLLVLRADPTIDIRNTRQIAFVVKRGQILER